MDLDRATAAKVILDLCDRSGTRLSEVCRAAGLKYSTLHAQIHNMRPIPFETIVAVARHFDVPLERFSSYFADISIQEDAQHAGPAVDVLANRYASALQNENLALHGDGFAIGTDDVLDWLRTQNGRLTNFDRLCDHVDLFHPVADGERIFRPYRIGRLSLAARSFRAEDEAHFQTLVEQAFDPELMKRVIEDHREAAVVPYKVSDEKINIMINGAHLQGAYRRIMAPVTDLQGNRFTLVYSRRI